MFPHDFVRPHDKGTVVRVWLKPRSAKAEVDGLRDDSLRVTVKAPPIEDRANHECLKVLADRLDLPVARLTILRGKKSQRKEVLVEGLDPAKTRQLLAVEQP